MEASIINTETIINSTEAQNHAKSEDRSACTSLQSDQSSFSRERHLGSWLPIKRSVNNQFSLSGYAEVSLRGSSAC